MRKSTDEQLAHYEQPSMMGCIVSKVLHLVRHWPFLGRAAMIRKLSRILPALQDFPVAMSPVTKATLDLRDAAAVGMFLQQGIPHEHGLLSLLLQFLKAGDTLYDIGANLGYYTLILSEPSYELAHIYAFEPNSGLARRLMRNAAHRPTVAVIPVGLAEASGVATLRLDPRRSDLANFRPGSTGEESTVTLRSLDDLIGDGTILPASVIKLDVEGFEYKVLQGYKLRDLHQPAIFMEWSDFFSQKIGIGFNDLVALFGENWVIFRVENDGALRDKFIEQAATTNDILLVWRGSANHRLAIALTRQ